MELAIMPEVFCDRVGDRIHIDWQAKGEVWWAVKDQVKGIIGSRFSPAKKVWTLPLDMETCRRLRDTFGDNLVIGTSLWDWAKEARAKEESAKALLGIQDVDKMSVVTLDRVPRVAPTMWAAMEQRPYQPVAALYMAKMRRCLNADQPGIGKTIETLGALVEANVTGRILVLAPRTSCLTVWPVEIERWLVDVPHTVTNLTGLTPAQRDEAWGKYEFLTGPVAGGAPDGMHFLIANAEQVGIKKFTVCPGGICDGDEDWCPELDKHVNKSEKRRPMLHSVEWDAIIADETHKWLINTRGKSASQVGYGFTKLRTADGESPMYALTGTPLKGKKYNVFGTLNWFWPKTYTSRWRFIESYWVVVKETVDAGRKGMIETRKITDDWISDKHRTAFFRSMDTHMIRRTKDELRAVNPAWMPPEKRYHDVYVPLEGSQRAHYRAMEKGAAATLQGGRLTATGVLAEMTRLKQFACSDGELVNGEFKPTLPSAKYNWLLQFLEERGIEPDGQLSEDVRKVVVASQFTSVLNMIGNALVDKGINAYAITGETKDADRGFFMKWFQTRNDTRVMLINTNAGGVSITLDAADDMVILDETWVPDDQEQVEDRVHRASNVEHQVDVWYIRSKDTIEEAIAHTNYSKAEANHVVLDAQRGLRFAAERFGASMKGE